jgi:hypothetical protein
VCIETSATSKHVWYARRDYDRLLDAASRDRFRIHRLTDDPERADIILFVGSTEPNLSDVRAHSYLRRWPAKCFLHHTGDRVIPFLPGVYASIERRWYRSWWCRSGFYLRVFDHQGLEDFENIGEAPYLFSFVGQAANAPVRRRLLELGGAGAFIRDSRLLSSEQKRSVYVESMRDSKFILCPRGGGASSFRLFETMKVGRIPVVISDAWVPPVGPDWTRCSIRVAERDVANIPLILRSREADALQMGQAARREWEDWFSKEVAFHRITDWCLELLRSPRPPAVVTRFYVDVQRLRPYHFRHTVLSGLKRRLLSN